MIGETVSHYRIIEKLGSGGMGEVYLAEDTKLDRRVALKFLPSQLVSDEEFKARFTREAQAAAKLNHPNIITIYEVSEHDGRPYFAMENVEGRSLKDIIKSKELSTDQAVDIAMQICEGLQAAHDAGIVHRDIKPSNILIDKDGRCRILDFGLAAIQAEEKLTKSGSSLGTVNYMSPEQLQGEKVDHRSDIFSLGVVFYEMITGQLPFKGDYDAAVAYSIINDTPEPLARYKADTSDELQRIISKMLEKDRELRYQHVDDLMADLKIAGREAKTREARQPARRILIPASILLIIVALFLIFKPWKVVVEPDQQAIASENRLAIMYFNNMADPDDEQMLGEIVTNLLIADLSESQYVDVVSSQRLYDILKLLGREGEKKISEDIATQVAEKAGAKWMLQGNILQHDQEIILMAQLIDVASGNAVASQKVIGDINEKIFPIIDRLTVEVKKDLSLPTAAKMELDRPVANVTTHSAEAYRCYLEGLDYRFKGYGISAENKFREALSYDSTFAMAYLQLTYYTYELEREETMANALKYADKVSRKERYYIRSREAVLSRNYQQAIEEIEKLIAEYPDEKEAYYRLGIIYWSQSRLDDAIRQFGLAIDIDSLYKEPYYQLSWAYEEKSDFENSIWAINKYISLAPDEARPYHNKGRIYCRTGFLRQAIESYKKALEIDPEYWVSLSHLGHSYIFDKEYAKAESCYQALCMRDEMWTQSHARLQLAVIPLYQGKLEEALNILNKGIAADEIENAIGEYYVNKYFLKATIYQQQGKSEEALEEVEKGMLISQSAPTDFPDETRAEIHHWRHFYVQFLSEFNELKKAGEIAGALKKDIEENNPNLMHFYWYAIGCIELSRGNTDGAIVELKKAADESSGFSWFYMHYKLAETYLGAGRIEEAVSEFENTLSRYNTGRLRYRPICAVKAFYQLGLAYERSGWTNKAMGQYEEFLDIWKDADPGIEEIEDARARLARLKEGT